MQNQATSITKKNQKHCPEKLKIWIHLLNIIPSDKDFWALNIGRRKLSENNRLHLEALEELKKSIEDFPIEFQHFIYGREVDFRNPKFFTLTFLPDLDYWETCDALERFENFVDNRRLLKSMIRNHSSSSNKNSRQMPYILQPKTRMKIDEKGKIHFSFDEFTEALQGVEISRIKICENCSRIFWQGRSDQRGCDTKCANNIRVKDSRNLKKERGKQYEVASLKKLIKRKK